ncbi:MAG: cytochrome P450 [Pseudomonadales bacterium]|nr:cytochrome P450 [Pseudomonadales bacterium]
MFDPLSQAFAQDPYSVYDRLRQSPEPVFLGAMNCHLLSRYEDVESTARNPVMVRSLQAFADDKTIAEQQRQANFHDMPNHEQFVQFSMLERDGEVHRRMRMVVLRAFSKAFIEKHRSMVQNYVNGLLDQVLQYRDIEFVEDLAAQLPGHIIGKILGVPDEDCPLLRVWSEEIVQYFDADRTPENKARAESATRNFYTYLINQIDQRRKTPTGDLLTTLVQAEKNGELSETELVSTSLLILAGGHGSTIDVLGTGMLALLRNPETLKHLRGNPNLMGTAVQEMFRYDAPLPFFHRYASEDVTVMGQDFPKGTKFGLLYGSANRDSEAFPDAHQFRADRFPNRHVAFGRGAHLCLGNNLARLNLDIIFSTLLQRVASFELRDSEPQFRTGLSSRGLVSLPLRLRPA